MTSPLLVFTTTNGALLASEYQENPEQGFTDPLPGRPALSTEQNPYFEIQDWDFDATNTIAFGTSSGTQVGKPHFGEFSITRKIDLISPMLFYYLCSGTTFKYVDLLLSKPAGGNTNSLVYLVYGLGNVAVTSIGPSGNIDESPSEKVSLQYEELWFAYRRQKPDGSFYKWTIRGWDRVRNRPL